MTNLLSLKLAIFKGKEGKASAPSHTANRYLSGFWFIHLFIVPSLPIYH